MESTQQEPQKKTRHPDDSVTCSIINNSFRTRMLEEIETPSDIALHKQKKMSRSLNQNTIWEWTTWNENFLQGDKDWVNFFMFQ